VPLSITNRTRKKTPGVFFELIKDQVLGKKYDLSLAFVGSAVSRKLNRTLRGKDRPTNVLSFPLSDSSGEIFIDLSKAASELEKFGMTHKKFIVYLYIHGLLHLKGMEHGDRMEQTEKRLLAKAFSDKNNGATNRSGN
jgi:rRNA maturation RNase YbeY